MLYFEKLRLGGPTRLQKKQSDELKSEFHLEFMQHREHREWYSFAAVPKNEGKKATQMKLSFLLSILASLAVLSLSAPLNIDVAGPLKIDADVASTSLAAPLKIDAAAPQLLNTLMPTRPCLKLLHLL